MIPPSRIEGVGEGRTRGLVLVEGGVTYTHSLLFKEFYTINVSSWVRRRKRRLPRRGSPPRKRPPRRRLPNVKNVLG